MVSVADGGGVGRVSVRGRIRPLPTSPQRYRVQFTVGEDTHTKLRRLQALRREIPDGDPAAIVDRALTLLLEKVEKAKTGAAAPPTRYIERHVQRTVWQRDGELCAFVSEDGQRCTETAYLELHHIEPHAASRSRPHLVVAARGWHRVRPGAGIRPRTGTTGQGPAG